MTAEDVSVVQFTRRWLRYKIPPNLRRNKGRAVCIGQKQKWFFLRLTSNEEKIRFDTTHEPEFDDWRWVTFWHPLNSIVAFKKGVYRAALKEFYLLWISAFLLDFRKSRSIFHKVECNIQQQ